MGLVPLLPEWRGRFLQLFMVSLHFEDEVCPIVSQPDPVTGVAAAVRDIAQAQSRTGGSAGFPS